MQVLCFSLMTLAFMFNGAVYSLALESVIEDYKNGITIKSMLMAEIHGGEPLFYLSLEELGEVHCSAT